MTDGLVTRDLTLGYGAKPIVTGMDLTIPPGRFTVLAGPNGSGKSTLLRALAGTMRPRGGQVLLDGASVPAMAARDLARRVGILPQSPQAPEGMIVADLVRMGRFPHRGLLSRWSDKDEAAVTEAFRLTRTADLRDQPLDQLSGGQRQRAWIAMVLAQRSRIVLLDEPTTFLDLAHQIEVLHLIEDLVHAGRTVVAVLHDLNQAARHADHLILLDAGRIAAEGAPADVLTPQNVAQVFGVNVSILQDPETGRAMCIPKAR
ncbi:ABC transporter ATP-binding protein [Paracoccus caeni]|uniref:ABC transporter ATP-binding protein n=1 Tax=Paracoccus caeni TaxID=657651 RepID=A0A934SIH4_9RHOB|nr:ABC transporter ATP-binding protein [Paracoccus caeni]MBK4215962.1 ABC transporter ATP-binding protein [Paracoccus caeni]